MSTSTVQYLHGRYGRVAGGGGDSGRVYEYLAGMAGLQMVEGMVAECTST